MKKVMNWAAKEAQARKMSDGALAYSLQDCIEARDAMKGHDPDSEGYYQDEATIYSAEIRRRKEEFRNLNWREIKRRAWEEIGDQTERDLFDRAWRKYRNWVNGAIDSPKELSDVIGWLDAIISEMVNAY